MGCFTHTRCTACGALRQAGSGIFLLMLRHPDFCGISVKYPRNRLFSSFLGWRRHDSRRLRDAAPNRGFISRFLKILGNFIIVLSFLGIKDYSVTFFAAFREGQFLRKKSRSRIFQKLLRRSQELPRRPWCGPTVGLFICSLNWRRNASCRPRDVLGGDARNECF